MSRSDTEVRRAVRKSCAAGAGTTVAYVRAMNRITDEANAGGTERSSSANQEDNPSGTPEARRPRRRGFAAMDRDRVREIARKGGKAAHAAGTAHQFSSDEARVAGQKGGMAPHVRRGGVRHRPSGEAAAGSEQGGHRRGAQGDGR